MNFAAVLERISRFLGDRDQALALIGGHGLAAFGIPRATLDLDLLVAAEAQDDLIAFMEEAGYETLHRSSGHSNHLHRDPSLGRVDFVYVRGSTRDAIFGDAQRTEGPGGLTVLVPRPEHLAAMKVLAMKNDPSRSHRELADIQSLLGNTDCDRDFVRDYFAKHGLIALFDELDDETVGD